MNTNYIEVEKLFKSLIYTMIVSLILNPIAFAYLLVFVVLYLCFFEAERIETHESSVEFEDVSD